MPDLEGRDQLNKASLTRSHSYVLSLPSPFARALDTPTMQPRTKRIISVIIIIVVAICAVTLSSEDHRSA